MNRKQLFFKLSQWFLQKAGDAGSNAWLDLEVENNRLRRQFTLHENRRVGLVTDLQSKLRTHNELLVDVSLVDGLLSEGQIDAAQKYLRVALIKARHSSNSNEIGQQLAQAANRQNNMLQGLAGMWPEIQQGTHQGYEQRSLVQQLLGRDFSL